MLLVALAFAEPWLEDRPDLTPTPLCASSAPEGCYTHYVLLVDVDGDADLDALFAAGGGYYTSGDPAPMSAWRNEGGVFVEAGPEWFGGRYQRHRQLAAGDIDGDGDLDLVYPDAYGLQRDLVFIQTSPGRFAEEGETRHPVSSRAGATRLFDADLDGDLDLLTTDWGETPPQTPGLAHLYLNDGTGVFTESEFALPDDGADVGTGPIDVDTVDIDGDFDLDLLIASRVGNSHLLTNDGEGHFFRAPLPKQPGPYVYGPDACDIDGDNDLDLWLDNGGKRSSEQLLLNNSFGQFEDATAERISNNPSADDNEVQCADLDGDGDQDAVIASLSNEERVLINDGAGQFSLLPDVFPAVGDATLGLDLGDVDGDGRLDAVTAQGETGTSWVERLYLGTGTAVDTRPPTLVDAEVRGSVLWLRARDATVGDGPGRVRITATVDGTERAARWSGGDLFRIDGVEAPITVTLEDQAGNRVDADIGAPPAEDPEGCGGCDAGGSPGWFSALLLLAARRRR